MRIVFFARDLSRNELGRVYCLWLLTERLGWSSIVVSGSGKAIWEPLRGTKFAECCVRSDDIEAVVRGFEPDLLIAGKPFVETLGAAQKIGMNIDVPVIVDNDDPDIEVGLSWRNPAKRIAREVFNRARVKRYRQMRRVAKSVPNIVSNPTLQRRWGGIIVPHVRPDEGLDVVSTSSDCVTVAFVGTNRAHKGVPELRKAVGAVQDLGFRLVLTSSEPDDAKPWEDWVGTTSMEEGTRLVRAADIAVIPSRRTSSSTGQLPAKLMDAMIAGRAIIASDLPPIRWATAGTAKLTRPGSARSLELALREMANEDVRQELGRRARQRALSSFTPEANVDAFRRLCESLVRDDSDD